MKLLRILLLLTLAAPGLSQSEDEPYFSLSSNRTFGAGGKPAVSLNAWNVKSLEFRVYRVNDPVQFFQQLESAHEFGGRVPRPPHQRTHAGDAYTSGSTACGPVSGAGCAASSRNRRARMWRAHSEAQASPPQTLRPRAERSMPKLRC